MLSNTHVSPTCLRLCVIGVAVVYHIDWSMLYMCRNTAMAKMTLVVAPSPPVGCLLATWVVYRVAVAHPSPLNVQLPLVVRRQEDQAVEQPAFQAPHPLR